MNAEHAVFMVHEFVTDQPELAENDAALSTFIDTVFPGTTLPGDEDLPPSISRRGGSGTRARGDRVGAVAADRSGSPARRL